MAFFQVIAQWLETLGKVSKRRKMCNSEVFWYSTVYLFNEQSIKCVARLNCRRFSVMSKQNRYSFRLYRFFFSFVCSAALSSAAILKIQMKWAPNWHSKMVRFINAFHYGCLSFGHGEGLLNLYRTLWHGMEFSDDFNRKMKQKRKKQAKKKKKQTKIELNQWNGVALTFSL